MLYFGSQMVKNRTGRPARWALPRILVIIILSRTIHLTIIIIFTCKQASKQVHELHNNSLTLTYFGLKGNSSIINQSINQWEFV